MKGRVHACLGGIRALSYLSILSGFYPDDADLEYGDWCKVDDSTSVVICWVEPSLITIHVLRIDSCLK